MSGNRNKGTVYAISVSERKGTKKVPVPTATLCAGFGIRGDAHAGPGTRQVSLMSWESIQAFNARGKTCAPGDFAENICVAGLDFSRIRPGMRMRLGQTAELEVTRIGKECHRPCAIAQEAGVCIMPQEGIFCRVISGGMIRAGDDVHLLSETRDKETEYV